MSRARLPRAQPPWASHPRRRGDPVSHYKSNLRDIEFNLFEVFGREEILGTGPFEEVDARHARSILAEIERHGHRGPRRRPSRTPTATRRRTTPTTSSVTHARGVQEELPGLDGLGVLPPPRCPPSWAVSPAPPSVVWSLAEMVLGSNPPSGCIGRARASPTWSATTAPSARSKIAQHMVDREVGRHHGAHRARRRLRRRRRPRQGDLQEDGTWHIEGVKRFITSGEHDMSENIIHLVLARPVGHRGRRRPRHQGPVAVHRPEVPLRPRDR